jgi:ADP-dependent NAD(P)H-hydrate dehydratase / NAD(P)H-hydrate epimerase
MKILSAAQIREADAYTIKEEQISSADLMERAAKAFSGWFENKFSPRRKVRIFCGPGNNGGDGLAVARLLQQANYPVDVFAVGDPDKRSPDFETNLSRLPDQVTFHIIKEKKELPALSADDLVIDGLFGTGLSRKLEDLFADTVAHLNNSKALITAIDLPSGLFTDSPTPAGSPIIKATYTVGFELPKLSYLLPQNGEFVGEWFLVPIGISPQFIREAETSCYYVTAEKISALLKPRPKFSHKGTYGHALLIGGSYGKIGAISLSAKGCLRSGAGLVTVYCPEVGYSILQTAVPEVMVMTDENRNHITSLPDLGPYQAIGVGPGLGKEEKTRQAIGQLLKQAKVPLVIDADAINILSERKELLRDLPPGSVFTPHPKEFERLVGTSADNYQRLQLLRDFCQKHECYVVLKGTHTCTGTPDGELWFNSTGNSGLATGGTGDVLTGVLTALVAQPYSAKEACILGVYLHGLAGHLASIRHGEASMIASDVVDHLGQAFLCRVGV